MHDTTDKSSNFEQTSISSFDNTSVGIPNSRTFQMRPSSFNRSIGQNPELKQSWTDAADHWPPIQNSNNEQTHISTNLEIAHSKSSSLISQKLEFVKTSLMHSKSFSEWLVNWVIMIT